MKVVIRFSLVWFVVFNTLQTPLCATTKITDDLFYDLKSTSTCFDQNRKISAHSLFNGIAQSCANLGNVIGAESPQEQQAAAIGLVGSVFNMAALLSKKEKPKQNSQKSDFTEKITNLTCDLLDALRTNPMRPLFITENSVLFQIDQLKNRDDKQTVIRQCLQSKDLAQPFLQELFNVVSKFVSTQLSKTLMTLTFELPIQMTNEIEDEL